MCWITTPRTYVRHADLVHVRWVNDNDIVTRVPPTWLRDAHTGRHVYLDSQGAIRRLTRRQRSRDHWEGFVSGLEQRTFDHFSDHAVAAYVEYLARAAGR